MNIPGSSPIASASPRAAFTLPEVLIATTLFILLLGGIVAANLFGMRMSQLVQTKLIASDSARIALGRLTDEIRNCKSTSVGNVSNGVFIAHLDGEVQAGSGLLIQPSTNAANYILYFLNSDHTFRRTTSSPVTTTVLAGTVTNTTVFSAQDYLGNVLTNSQDNRVIHVTLQFFQPQPHLPVADYYKLETSVTKRAL
ncbi:MAG TPA: hypothetical protein VN578_25680 [Candidatus Binatia bacterium]|jgi:hypothetical protein|nr:hypothetical protein [Candidatus Binatia bacterium]